MRKGLASLVLVSALAATPGALAVLPDGRLASGADDRTIRLWDAATGAQIAWLDLDSAIRSLCWLPQTRLLVAGDTRGRLHWLELT